MGLYLFITIDFRTMEKKFVLNENKFNVGWIGTGILGSAIVKRLLACEINTFIYNRTHRKANLLKKNGACVCNSVSEVFKKCQVVFLCVTGSKAFDDLILVNLPELKNKNKSKKILIDVSTVNPDFSKSTSNILKKHGVAYFDCPVSGGVKGALSGKMTAICSGNKNIFLKIHQIISFFCDNIEYVGSIGKAQELKIINNLAESINLVCASEVILLALSLGHNIKNIKKVLSKARGRSAYMDLLLEKLTTKNTKVDVTLEVRMKDLLLANDLIKKNLSKLKLSSLVLNIFKKTIKHSDLYSDQTKCFDYIEKQHAQKKKCNA